MNIHNLAATRPAKEQRQTLADARRIAVHPVKAHPNDTQSTIVIITNKIIQQKKNN